MNASARWRLVTLAAIDDRTSAVMTIERGHVVPRGDVVALRAGDITDVRCRAASAPSRMDCGVGSLGFK